MVPKVGSQLFPLAFIFRRLHSLTGLFISLFLIQHLYVNSQAALFLGDDGKSFISSVNDIHSIPYLPLIEITLLAIPILIHIWWGILYVRTAKFNSLSSDGSAPSLPNYPRNHAFTWQRITSWILLFAIIAHVVHMRFIRYPEEVENGYAVELVQDPGIDSLAKRLDVKLEPQNGQIRAVAPDFGTAELLVVREAFKSPLIMALYTIFVLAACFHGFNGVWTFMISWGITISERSQKSFSIVTNGVMVAVAFLGLTAIYLTYWINLYE